MIQWRHRQLKTTEGQTHWKYTHTPANQSATIVAKSLTHFNPECSLAMTGSSLNMLNRNLYWQNLFGRKSTSNTSKPSVWVCCVCVCVCGVFFLKLKTNFKLFCIQNICSTFFYYNIVPAVLDDTLKSACEILYFFIFLFFLICQMKRVPLTKNPFINLLVTQH